MQECKKLKYPSEANALHALKIIRNKRKRPASHSESFAYKCPFCGKWHLTSEKQYRNIAKGDEK